MWTLYCFVLAVSYLYSILADYLLTTYVSLQVSIQLVPCKYWFYTYVLFMEDFLFACKQDKKKGFGLSGCRVVGLRQNQPENNAFEKRSTRPDSTRIWTLGAQLNPTQPVFWPSGLGSTQKIGSGLAALARMHEKVFLGSDNGFCTRKIRQIQWY
jgi:hypothetical protein